MPNTLLQDGQVVQVNDQVAQRDRMAGVGLPPDFTESENMTWRRWLPGGRVPWQEVSVFEAEITKFDQRRSEIEGRRLELTEQLRVAPEHDAQALAQWQRDGQPGSRPEPSGPQLENELKQLQEDEQALIRAADSVASERVAFVEKNRSRLVGDAVTAEDRALERAQQALQELEEAREALVQTRRVRIWSELYPAQEIGREPQWLLLGGGLRRISQKLGLETIVGVSSVLDVLRADLDWVSTAASAEQRAKLGARPLTQAERERARDAQIEDQAAVRRQLAADERRGELDALKAKL